MSVIVLVTMLVTMLVTVIMTVIVTVLVTMFSSLHILKTDRLLTWSKLAVNRITELLDCSLKHFL